MRWALCRLGAPAHLVDAIFRLYGSAFIHIVLDGGAVGEISASDSRHSLRLPCVRYLVGSPI